MPVCYTPNKTETLALGIGQKPEQLEAICQLGLSQLPLLRPSRAFFRMSGQVLDIIGEVKQSAKAHR